MDEQAKLFQLGDKELRCFNCAGSDNRDVLQHRFFRDVVALRSVKQQVLKGNSGDRAPVHQ
jgi:hypothetical protein